MNLSTESTLIACAFSVEDLGDGAVALANRSNSHLLGQVCPVTNVNPCCTPPNCEEYSGNGAAERIKSRAIPCKPRGKPRQTTDQQRLQVPIEKRPLVFTPGL